MTKFQSIRFCGILMIIIGIFLMASPFASSMALQYTVSFGMIAIAVFAWITTYKSKHLQLPFKYHELHAIGFVMYSLSVLFFATTIERFIHITTCFFIFYGTAELIFCFQLLNQRAKISLQMILLRSFIAVSIYSGALFIINSAIMHPNRSIQIAGFMFVVSGLNMFLYKVILQKMELPTNSSRTV